MGYFKRKWLRSFYDSTKPINAPQKQSRHMNYILWDSPSGFLGQHLGPMMLFQFRLFPVKRGIAVPVD